MSLFLTFLIVLPFCIFGKERYFTCVRSRTHQKNDFRPQARICFVRQKSNSDCKSACSEEQLKTKLSKTEHISALVIEGESISKCYDGFSNMKIDVKRHACDRRDFWFDKSPLTKKMRAQVDTENAVVVRREMENQNNSELEQTEIAVPQEAKELFLGACLGWLWNRIKDSFFRRSGIFAGYANFVDKAKYFRYCFPRYQVIAIRDYVRRVGRWNKGALKNLPYAQNMVNCVKGKFYQRYLPNPGLQIGFSVGGAVVIGVGASVDFTVSLKYSWNKMTTVTGCMGIKTDASFAVGAFVALFGDMNNVPGDSVVVSAGADIPGTEAGLSFAQVWSTNNRDLYAVAVDVGVGLGLSPIDISCSRCRTSRVWVDAKDTEQSDMSNFISSPYFHVGGAFFVTSILLGLFKIGGKLINNPSNEKTNEYDILI